MHLIKDENGNMVGHSHGDEHVHEHTHADGQAHSHEHTHEHGHDHEHSHDHCHEDCGSCESNCDPKKEALAVLTYMLQHNEHHAAELDQMAENLGKLGMEDAAKQIKEGVSDFQKGNMRLSLALTLVKEAAKEEA
ncbi:MAG: cobalt transporter [Lachnospiraceae bacterium]|nr:cobalt transporter [Lachnospiraceae bacterium]